MENVLVEFNLKSIVAKQVAGRNLKKFTYDRGTKTLQGWYHVAVEGLASLNDLKSTVGGAFMALTEFPMPDWSCGRDQTKFLQPFLHFYGRLSIWLTTRSCTKHYVTETATNICLPVGGDLPERQNGASMTGYSENLREAADTKMEVLTTKYKTRVGFWNVRTMYEIRCLAQVTSELRRYGLTLLGISECRWTDSGRIKVATGETVLYSGPSDRQHREVVALILKKGTDKCLLQWKPVSSRMMSARLKGRHINMTVIQCYVPTNDSEAEMRNGGKTWGQLSRLAEDRSEWRNFVAALCQEA